MPLTAAPGDNAAAVADSAERTPAPDGPLTPSVGIVELSERVVASILTRFPWLYRAGTVLLAVFAVFCLAGVATRLSPLPLIPLPLFALAWYFLRFLRAADTRRLQLRWALLTALSTMVGFWLISVVARWVSS